MPILNAVWYLSGAFEIQYTGKFENPMIMYIVKDEMFTSSFYNYSRATYVFYVQFWEFIGKELVCASFEQSGWRKSMDQEKSWHLVSGLSSAFCL